MENVKINIGLLTGFYPESIRNVIADNTKSAFQDAANILQYHIIEGLSYYNSNIDVINAPFIGYYPIRYKKKSSPHCIYKVKKNTAVINVNSYKFSTIPFLFKRTRKKRAYQLLLQWLENKKEGQNVIVIYSVHTPFMEACIRLKSKYPSLKIVLIVPDLPQYMNASKALHSRIHQYIIKLFLPRLKNLYNQMDGFIFLTEAMNLIVNKLNKPYAIVEGISTNSSMQSSVSEKYLFYSGTMAEKYGVMNLVKAFLNIRHKEYKLILCGEGDSVEKIKEISLKNSNIIYLGKLSNDKVRLLQIKAKLLINPRQNIGEYTKYSFPSKVMEYFSSGRPTLMYKLDGILDEYYKYCFSLTDNKIQSLTEKIDQILDIDESILTQLGLDARNFIMTYKTPKKQCEKIQKIIQNLFL